MRNDRKTKPTPRRGEAGQALVEYALIALLVIVALAAALYATGPAIGNVFSSAVLAAIGEDQDRLPPGAVDADGDGVPDNANEATRFWQTVQALEGQDPFIPPEAFTPAPTETPEGFVASETPTPTDPPPTETMLPSPTNEPSATPEDRSWVLPFEDDVQVRPEDDPWYRLTSNTYLGQNAWTARNYQDGPDGEPLAIRNLRSTDSFDANTQRFVFPGYDIPRVEERYFSVQLRREITVYEEDANLSFRLNNPTGGVRVYYQDEGTCADFEPASNARDAETTSSCMIMDEWAGAPPENATTTQLFNYAGGPTTYVIYIEFYHSVGAPNLDLDITSSKFSPDDTGLNNVAVNCNWGVYEGRRTNSRPYSWNSAVGLDSNNFPNNQRCYLELRGYIDLSDEGGYSLTGTPALMFWHIWDLNPSTRVWLEVAEYPDPLVDGDITNINWQDTGWEASPNTRNYEWTKEQIPLNGFTNGDRITYRFVMENDGGGGGRKRWYVDDIQLGNAPQPDLTDQTPPDADTIGVADFLDGPWSFDEAGKGSLVDFNAGPSNPVGEFTGTARWEINETGAFAGNAIVNDPGNPYSIEPGSGTGSTPLDRRIYQLEFSHRVDVTDTTPNDAQQGLVFQADDIDGNNIAPPDADEDTGAPALSFFHTYQLRDNVALQIQYYDDLNDQWTLLREIVRTGSSGEASNTSPSFVQVPLHELEQPDANGYGTGVFDDYADGWTDWATQPLRLRFAMVVNENAINSAEDSWAIDDIRIERLGAFNYTPYPIYDSAGDPIAGNPDPSINDSLNRWQRTGTWNIADRDGYTGDFLFTDSPNTEYIPGSDSTLSLRSPIDLNSDTPTNPYSQACDDSLDAVTSCNADTGDPVQDVAQDPVMSFWWYRDLGNGSRFTVEARDNAGAGAPITLWEYNYDASNARQPAWERVEIALDPFVTRDGSNLDDDIVLRFRLNNTGNSNVRADGVWIDDVRIEDRPDPMTFRLWDGTGTNGETGNGVRYVDSIDNRTNIAGETADNNGLWWRRWYLGGSWFSDIYSATAITEIDNNGDGVVTENDIARSGTQVFHESPNLIDIPYSFDYEQRSFNVLEMRRTIDMTGLNTTRAQNDPPGISTGGDVGNPIMYWWQRQDRGNNARLMVQVATRGGNTDTDPLTYGADELSGWSEWTTIYISDNNGAQDYAWRREGVNLQAAPVYNANGTQTGTRDFVGEEIRVRFVLNATAVVTEGDTRDGWYIDDVEFTVAKLNIFTLPFSDNAQSMNNWVGEGTWGLDAATFRGSGEAPVGGSDWTVHYVNCDYRPNNGNQTNSDRNCGGNRNTIEDMLTDAEYRDTYGDASVNDGDRWYLTETITTLNFERDFDSDYNASPPSAPGNFDWQNDFGAEFQRTISINTPTRYQFYIKSDDGARVGITPLPTTSEIRQFASTSGDTNIPVAGSAYTDTDISPDPIFYNNVINDWVDRAPTVSQGATTLIPNQDFSPREYRLTVHYYENGGDANIAFGMSGASASFADSPVSVPPPEATSFDAIPANHLSNTSLQLKGLLDLRSANKPLLRYYTNYDINNVGTAYLEVSEDGGFTWTRDNLRDQIDYPGGSTNAQGLTSWTGDSDNRRDETAWEERLNTLEDYRGQMIGLRFRLDINADLDRQLNDMEDGLYISDVLVFDLAPTTPAPQIIINPPLSLYVSADDIANEEQQISVVATGQRPLLYEWFQGEPPTGDPGAPRTVPAGNIAVGNNSDTLTLPNDLEPDRYTFWVRIHNDLSANDPNVPPAVSVPTRVRVAECAAIDVGDCDIYRVNVNGNDLTTRDGSVPDWGGDRDGQSAATYKPNGNSFERTDNNITLPNANSNEFVRAAIAGPAPEDLYETGRATNSEMSWSFPVEAGEYTVRLYIADYGNSNNLGNFSVTANDGQGGTRTARYNTSGTTQPLQNINFFDLVEQNNRTAALIELDAVTVSPQSSALKQSSALNLKVLSENNDEIMVSGVEVFPVTDLDPIIVQEPQDVRIQTGGTVTLRTVATGANLAFQWYEGTSGDTSTPLTTDPANVGGLSGNSALEVVNVTSVEQYWVRITGGPDTDNPITLDSRTATVEPCNFDPTVYGSCDNYYLNITDGTNEIDAGDGTRWHPSNDTTDMRTYDFDGNGWTFSGSNVDANHVPQDVFDTYRQAENYAYDFDVDDGYYDVTVYVADRENDSTNRAMDITVEDSLLADNFHPLTEGANASVYYSITFENVEVVDGNLEIEFDRYDTSGLAVRVNGIEVKPAGT